MKTVLNWCSKSLGILLLASLTLGLAPFLPEPHVWGKLKWVFGGAVGMQLMDWLDLLLHGLPWLLLFLGLVGKFFNKQKETKQ